MFFITFLLILVNSNVRLEAVITEDTISDFNIGQLFAFYNTIGLCDLRAPSQFAVAKRVGSGKCQWKIDKNYTPQPINKESDLPVADFKGNCYFSCVHQTLTPRLHTEKVINRHMKDKGIDRKQFDMYTFLAPCPKCQVTSKNNPETAELDQFKAVYWTINPGKYDTQTYHQVKNDALLYRAPANGNSGAGGLLVIKEKTKVDLTEVKNEIETGKNAKKSDKEIIAGVNDEYLKNAVVSYLEQHP